MSDESGYVLSQAALGKIFDGMKNGIEACQENDGPADINLGSY